MAVPSATLSKGARVGSSTASARAELSWAGPGRAGPAAAALGLHEARCPGRAALEPAGPDVYKAGSSSPRGSGGRGAGAGDPAEVFHFLARAAVRCCRARERRHGVGRNGMRRKGAGAAPGAGGRRIPLSPRLPPRGPGERSASRSLRGPCRLTVRFLPFVAPAGGGRDVEGGSARPASERRGEEETFHSCYVAPASSPCRSAPEFSTLRTILTLPRFCFKK